MTGLAMVAAAACKAVGKIDAPGLEKLYCTVDEETSRVSHDILDVYRLL